MRKINHLKTITPRISIIKDVAAKIWPSEGFWVLFGVNLMKKSIAFLSTRFALLDEVDELENFRVNTIAELIYLTEIALHL